jgi:hypothetical protein
MPNRSLVCLYCIDKNLAVIVVQTRYGGIGIVGLSLTKKIPIVGNREKVR